MAFHQPPKWQTPKGKDRRVGFEFELANIEAKPLAEMVQRIFGGEIERRHDIYYQVKDTKAGDFTIELDAHPIQQVSDYVKNSTEDLEKDDVKRSVMEKAGQWVKELAETVVPYEIVTPPLAFEQFEQLDGLMEELREAQAKGTQASVIYAFGMHLNPEIYDDHPRALRDVLRAFLLLYPWFVEEMQVDAARRITPFINPFPKKYIKKILALEYAPDLEQFIKDYLRDNPTRNRALDMLPLFAELKPELLDVLDKSQRELVKARPTFHYRLPNCDFDQDGWSIAKDWNLWVEVEKLAQDEKRLTRLSRDYLTFLDKPLHMISSEWAKKMDEDMA